MSKWGKKFFLYFFLKIFNFLDPWNLQIAVEDDVIKSAYLMKRTIFQDVSVFPEKLFRFPFLNIFLVPYTFGDLFTGA